MEEYSPYSLHFFMYQRRNFAWLGITGPLGPKESMMTICKKWDIPIVLIKFTTLVTQVLADLKIEHTNLQPNITEGYYYFTFKRNVIRDVLEQSIVSSRKEQSQESC